MEFSEITSVHYSYTETIIGFGIDVTSIPIVTHFLQHTSGSFSKTLFITVTKENSSNEGKKESGDTLAVWLQDEQWFIINRSLINTLQDKLTGDFFQQKSEACPRHYRQCLNYNY